VKRAKNIIRQGLATVGMVKEEITSEIEWKGRKVDENTFFLSSFPSLELRVHVFRHHLSSIRSVQMLSCIESPRKGETESFIFSFLLEKGENQREDRK